ncbi:MAG: xanthine dehydrogenase family protein molybdopterin-binding subunit [Actinobacteria bacterium]|nr:xanthine dehydrogenase family protein molybdopterin-binding subunit [Actinomycetota bacterium]
MIGSILGHPVLRTEDPRFLTGEANYTDDVPVEGSLYAIFVRSFMAYARVGAVDTSAARAMDGVQGVFTAADLDLDPYISGEDPDGAFVRPLLATDVVRFVGEPVAVVVAASRAQAVDAAEMVMVDYEPLEHVTDPEAAIKDDAPVLFPDHGSNIAVTYSLDATADFGDADVIVEGRFVNQRLAAVPLEVNSICAMPDPEGEGIKAWVSCQAPFTVARDIGKSLGINPRAVHVIASNVGGGFGAKIPTYPEHLVVAGLARKLDRPVRWTESRSENMTAMTQGRAQTHEVKIGAKHNGAITALKVRVIADQGAYPGDGLELARLTRKMTAGVYRIPRIEFEALCVATNTTPTMAYRGAGRPEAAALVERAVDMLAVECKLDPVDVRRKNFIGPDEFPYETPAGSTYDVGDYAKALDVALEVAGYEDLRKEQARRREAGETKALGIGVSCYVETTGFGLERGSVEVHEDGKATVTTGTSPHGQGHETAWAQIVAGTLGIDFDSITVLHSDTRRVVKGEGTMGSRSLQVGGSSVFKASETVLAKAKQIAAHMLEVGADDIVHHDDGRLGVAGVPDSAVAWAELASAAKDPARLPEAMEPGLGAVERFGYGDDEASYPFGTHIAVTEVDVETGEVELLRHIAVDDCGRILNPILVQGQVHGGIAQGVAQALFEEVVYDEGGNPITANLATYQIPSAADLPSFETAQTETPTPLNPMGAKGIGESGTIGSTPAVQNSVVDAVSHLGVRHIDMPLKPLNVWSAIQQASG